MAFKDELSSAIEKSGFTIREIAKKCTDLGVPITHAYISQLRSGKSNPPSEEIIKVLSKICDIDENILILEAYLERAPEFLITLLHRFKYEKDENKINFIYSFIYSCKDEEEKKIMNKSIEYIKEKSLAQFLIDAYEEHDPTPVEELETQERITHNNEVKSNNNEIIDFKKIKVKDNAMYPLIPKNSVVHIESFVAYKNNDIICFTLNNEDNGNIFIRKYYRNDELIILSPYNNEFELMIYNISDIKILGKVNKIIINL